MLVVCMPFVGDKNISEYCQRSMVDTYTGWCHAGRVILIFLVSAGGKYFSSIRARGVEEKWRFDDSPGRWARQ